MAKPKRSATFAAIAAQAKLGPSSDDAWTIVYFQRHKSDDPATEAPGRKYLLACPNAVRATFRNVLIAVSMAPPPRFAGGGYWEAMKNEMTGYYEVRKKHQGHHYRLFCLLDKDSTETGPLLVVLAGMTKLDKTIFSKADYAAIKSLGDEYLGRQPRSVYPAQAANS